MIKKLILLAIVCLFATPRTLSAQLAVDLADGAGYDFQGLAAGGSVDLGGAGTPSRFSARRGSSTQLLT